VRGLYKIAQGWEFTLDARAAVNPTYNHALVVIVSRAIHIVMLRRAVGDRLGIIE